MSRKHLNRWRRVALLLGGVALVMVMVVAGCPQGNGPAAGNNSPAAGSDNSTPTDGSAADDAGGQGDGASTAGDNANDNTGDSGGDSSADDNTPDGGNDDNNPPGDDQPSIAFTFDPATLTGKYLMAFLGCEGGGDVCGDPTAHRVYIASSDDGVHWTVPDGWTPYVGSVPDVVERDDKLYIYTPNQVVFADLTTGEVTEPVDVEVEGDGLPAGFVDPSPTLDDQGRIVLFFIAGSFDGAIGTCAGGETTCTVNVYSATETDDRDGIHFTLDAGARAEVDVDIASDIKTATDPDIFYDGTQYVLYVSHGQAMSVWTSATLTGTYTRVTTLPDGMITPASGGVGSGLFDAETGMYWTYAHKSSGDTTVIRRAVHADFSAQLTADDFTTVIEGADLGFDADSTVGSPGIWLRQ